MVVSRMVGFFHGKSHRSERFGMFFLGFPTISAAPITRVDDQQLKYGAFQELGDPQNGWFKVENLINMINN